MIRVTLALCALCMFQEVLGQKESFSLIPTPIRYNINDGLPSKETYDILQDDDGIIWVASDRGVSSFNGYEFNTFTTADGLMDNCIIRMDMDEEGRIWLLGANGQLTLLDNNNWISPSINDQLENKSKFSRPMDMAIDDGDTVWIFYSSVRAGTSLAKYHHSSNESIILSKELPNYPILVKTCGQNSISALHYPYNGQPVQPYAKLGQVDGLGGLPKHTSKLLIPMTRLNGEKRRAPSFVYSLTRTRSDKFHNRQVISVDNVFYHIMNQRLVQLFQVNSEILDMHLSKDSLWIATRNQGVFLYALDADSFVLKNRFLQGNSVSSVLRDRVGDIWFTTLNSGIVHLPQGPIYTSELRNLKTTNVRKIRRHKDKLVILSSRRTLQVLGKEREKFVLRELKKYPRVIDFSIDKTGIVWPTGNNRVKPIHVNGDIVEAVAPRGMIRHYQTQSGLYVGARYSTAFIGKNPNIEGAEKVFDLPSIRPNAFYEDEDHRLLLGTSAGIFQISTDSFWKWKPDQPFSKESVTTIAEISSNHVIGTLGNGLYIESVKNNFLNISRKQGLLSNAVNDILVIDSVTLAVASNKGVGFLNISNLSEISFTHLNVKNGLLSNDVQALEKLGNYMAIGTAEGLNFWALDGTVPSTNSINILIDGVENGTESLPVKNAYEIQENKDGLTFHFTGIDYTQRGNITYAYRLSPVHNNWLTTHKRSIQFNSFAFGEHYLEISAIDPTTKEVIPTGKKIIISVVRPFYKSPWFSLGVSLIVILFMAVLSYVYVKMIKKQNHLHQQLMATEQNALKAQMNPHFLFNAMNSVQNFIAINDKKAAFTFIARFSQLVRSIVDNSTKKMVSLHEEMEGWKAYLELEKIRFDNKFDYNLYVNQQASFKSQEIEIPGMLVQPFLENALLHGLRPLDHKGMLSINVLSDSEYLTISICDNGIGRKKSAENRRKLEHYHDSQGLKNIEKRIELLNTLQKVSIFLDIVDIDDNGKTGTLVILKFRTNDQ